MFKVYKKEIEVAGKKISLETGKVARQADGAIIATSGETVILATVVGAKKVNIKKLSIETGASDFFKPARKLFKQCGFEPCKPFAHYKEDINSVYLSKLIVTTDINN